LSLSSSLFSGPNGLFANPIDNISKAGFDADLYSERYVVTKDAHPVFCFVRSKKSQELSALIDVSDCFDEAAESDGVDLSRLLSGRCGGETKAKSGGSQKQSRILPGERQRAESLRSLKSLNPLKPLN
jgi:hypothetical protein